MQNTKWFVRHADLTYGPLETSEIAAGLENGFFLWVDLAIEASSESETREWRLINQIDEFRALLNQFAESADPSAEWVIRKKSNGELSGPYSVSTILKLIAEGKVLYSDYVWHETLEKWSRIGDVAALDRHANMKKLIGPPPKKFSEFCEEVSEVVAKASTADLLKNVYLSGTLSPRPQVPLIQVAPNVVHMPLSEDLVEEPEWVKILTVVGFCLLTISASFQARAATILKILPVKISGPKPSLVFQTDAASGEVISVLIKGRSGEILALPSYMHREQIKRKEGDVATLDLTKLKLPTGTYQIEASVGAEKASTSIFLGAKDSAFNEALKAHIKQLAAQQQAEKKALYYSSRQMENLSQSLVENFESTRLTPKTWSSFFAEWRKKVEVALRPIRAVAVIKPLAYPEEVKTFMSTVDKLNHEAVALDKNVLQARDVANDVAKDVATSEQPQLADEFRAIKTLAGKLTNHP